MTKVEALEVDYEPEPIEEPMFKPTCSFCGDPNEIEDSCILQENPAEKSHPQRSHETTQPGLYFACKSCIDIHKAGTVLPTFEDFYVCDRCECETEMGIQRGHEYDVFEIEESETFEDMVTILEEPYTTRHLCADCWKDVGIYLTTREKEETDEIRRMFSEDPYFDEDEDTVKIWDMFGNKREKSVKSPDGWEPETNEDSLDWSNVSSGEKAGVIVTNIGFWTGLVGGIGWLINVFPTLQVLYIGIIIFIVGFMINLVYADTQNT